MRARRGAAVVGLALAVLSGAAWAQTSGVTTRVSVDVSGSEANAASTDPAVSADGRYVAFVSWASDVASGDTGGHADVFVRDRLAQTTERVSVSSAGLEGGANSDSPAISADGRFVAFRSNASNLVADDLNGRGDIFVHDRMLHATERVSVEVGGGDSDGESLLPAISADGRFVTFESHADNLVAGFTTAGLEIYRFDRQGQTTTRISNAFGGGNADAQSFAAAISGDGCVVAFASFARNLTSSRMTDRRSRIYLWDCGTGETSLVSKTATGQPSFAPSNAPSLSADGRHVAYQSKEPALASGHAKTRQRWDVFAYDRVLDETELVSRDKRPPDCGREAQDFPCELGDSRAPQFSADGRFIVFSSDAMVLLPGNLWGGPQVYVYNRQTGLLRRVSVDATDLEGNRCNDAPAISGDGSVVAYATTSAHLIPGDANVARDVLTAEWTCPEPASGAPGDPLPQGCAASFECPAAPASCEPAERSTLRIRRATPGSDEVRRDELDWLWKGDGGSAAFGDPTDGTGYRLCVYSAMHVHPSTPLDHEANLPGGTGWRQTEHGYRLEGARGGFDRASFLAPGGDPARIRLRARGPGLLLPYLPLGANAQGPIAVRLHRTDDASCWGADFATEEIRVNEEGQNRAVEEDRPGRFLARAR